MIHPSTTPTPFRLAVIAAFFALLTAYADDSPRPQPPPLTPFADVNSPTEQVMSVESLLAFLPETLATYGERSAVTKSEIVKTMGMGLQMALMQGQRLTAEEARDIVHNLVEASLNLTMMLSFVAQDGIEPNSAQAQQEVERIKTDVGPDQFVAMLEMQGTTEQEMLARVAKKNVIDRWMEEKVESSVTVSDAEVEAYYNGHPEQFRDPTRNEPLPLTGDVRAEIVAQLRRRAVEKFLAAKYDQWRQENRVQFHF